VGLGAEGAEGGEEGGEGSEFGVGEGVIVGSAGAGGGLITTTNVNANIAQQIVERYISCRRRRRRFWPSVESVRMEGLLRHLEIFI